MTKGELFLTGSSKSRIVSTCEQRRRSKSGEIPALEVAQREFLSSCPHYRYRSHFGEVFYFQNKMDFRCRVIASLELTVSFAGVFIESPAEAAMRELKEETGIKLKLADVSSSPYVDVAQSDNLNPHKGRLPASCVTLSAVQQYQTLYTAKNYEPAVQQLATILCCTYCSQLSTTLNNIVHLNNAEFIALCYVL